MHVTISSALLGQIMAHAARTPGSEVCGLLFGDDRAITACRATANIAAQPRDSFEIDPQALFDAIRGARNGGPRMIGHYHSHPNGRPEPSLRDAEAAEPGRYWMILGKGQARLYLAEPGAQFRPIALEIR
jgi:proteasome lid subunit RPN8/RPN11